LRKKIFAIDRAKAGLGDTTILAGSSIMLMEFRSFKAFHSTYVFENASVPYMVFSFYAEVGAEIYDYTYKFPADNDIHRHEIIFWEFIRGVRVAGHQVLPDDQMYIIKTTNWDND
jgi:hypothetical protein